MGEALEKTAKGIAVVNVEQELFRTCVLEEQSVAEPEQEELEKKFDVRRVV